MVIVKELFKNVEESNAASIEYLETSSGRIPRDILELVAAVSKTVFQKNNPDAKEVAQLARTMLKKNFTEEDILLLATPSPWKEPKTLTPMPSFLNDELDKSFVVTQLEEEDAKTNYTTLGFAEPENIQSIN